MVKFYKMHSTIYPIIMIIVYGIIEINNSINERVPVGAGFPYVETGFKPVSTRKIPVSTGKIHGLSEMIRALKTFSSRRINEISDSKFAWQRSFHDRIIRSETEYIKIKNYIQNNPLNWSNPDGDEFNKHTG